MQLSLREAAQHVGVSKPTILRAIQSGRLSATRTEERAYRIDPAELMRVYPPDRLVPKNTVRHAPHAADENEVENRIRVGVLEAENKALRDVLEIEKRRAEEIRLERDSWKNQAERLLVSTTIVTPVPAPTPAPPTHSAAPSRSWWKWWGDRRAS